jgi:hypothetical protein
MVLDAEEGGDVRVSWDERATAVDFVVASLKIFNTFILKS